jgi:hypothetical protein
VTRERAVAELQRLAGGLPSDVAGVRRLLERISETDHGEDLRCALVELGAEAVLEGAIVDRRERVRRAVEKHMERAGA